MTKVLFDASIHLGQFCSTDEATRFACKNAQVRISDKNTGEVIGVCTYNENSLVDDRIWALERFEQDIFYPFMDLFHSVKNIIRVPLNYVDMALAETTGKTYQMSASSALSCAVAVREQAVIETIFPDLLSASVREGLAKQYGLAIGRPSPEGVELSYSEGDLEERYQETKRYFIEHHVKLLI